ncbi:MAG: stearoyl-CoA 9-desaturase [Micromonosporaceae bacterium]
MDTSVERRRTVSPIDWPSASESMRDSMRRLPAFVQLPLTYLTGKPFTDQRGLRLTPTSHLVGALGSIAVGLICSATAYHAIGATSLLVALFVPGWMLTLHGLRNLRMMVYHQCAHRNMWANTRADRMVGNIVAGLLLVQNLEQYSREHIGEHHALHHMSLRDPTVQAMLVGLGLRPGMTRAQMWRRVICQLLSPTFHARFAWGRLRSHVYNMSLPRLLATVASYGCAIAIVTWADLWMFAALAWVFPLTIPFQISNVLRLCVKHVFPDADTTVRRGTRYFGSLTNAIFLGDRAPERSLPPVRRMVAWVGWTWRLIFVHGMVRYLVLTGDTVCHDYHHRHPMSRDWPNYIFARQRDVDTGHPGWPPYREVWGLVPAINVVFDSLSRADPVEYDLAHLGEVNQRELFSAFDD